jgi:sugar lactone lactonase YvrE
MSGARVPATQASLELVFRSSAVTGEGPVWDEERGVVWWVDIPAGLIHGCDPRRGSDRAIGVGTSVGAVALRRDGSLLLALADRLAGLDPVDERLETLLELPPGDGPLRCNDGKADPSGRFWIGRMSVTATPGLGSLLRVDDGSRATPVLSRLTIPNGIGWSLDGRTMYFVESTWHEVRTFAFDPADGSLGRPRTLAAFPDDGSVPDGLAVDEEGCIWVARWGAGCVVRVGPDGTLLDRVDLPVSQPSSCAFGGDALADLYITSAREDLAPERLAAEPLAGSLFRCRPGVRGLPPDRVAW